MSEVDIFCTRAGSKSKTNAQVKSRYLKKLLQYSDKVFVLRYFAPPPASVLTDRRGDFRGGGVRIDGLLLQVLRALPQLADQTSERVVRRLGVDDRWGRGRRRFAGGRKTCQEN